MEPIDQSGITMANWSSAFSIIFSLVGILFLILYFIRPRLRLINFEIVENRMIKCTVINRNYLKRMIIGVECQIVSSDYENFDTIKTEDLLQSTIFALKSSISYTFIAIPDHIRPHIRLKFLASNSLNIKKYYEYTCHRNIQGTYDYVPSKRTHYMFG